MARATSRLPSIIIVAAWIFGTQPRLARSLEWIGGPAPPPILPGCTPHTPNCAEVSSPEEFHEALDSDEILEIVIVVPEIVLEAPVFSSDSKAWVWRDKLVRGHGSGSWPTLVNKMGNSPSDVGIEVSAFVMFLRLKLEGFFLLGETSTAKYDAWYSWEDALLSCPGVFFHDYASDIAEGNWTARPAGFPGAWLKSMRKSPNEALETSAGMMAQECMLSLKMGAIVESTASRAADPFTGVLELFKDLGFSWETSADTVDIFEWPLRTVAYHDVLAVTFWIWRSIRMFNSTIHLGSVNETASYEPKIYTSDLPPRTDCQSTGPLNKGLDYAGDWSSAGLYPDTQPACMAWKDVNFLGTDFAGLEGNSCRNPGTIHEGAFCFVPVQLKGLDLDLPMLKSCDIPECKSQDALPASQDCQHKSDKGRSYNGTLAVSESGKPCFNWEETIFFQYQAHDRNYCRNPRDGERDRLWCYTGYGYQWEYCDVPICQESSIPGLPGFGSNDGILDSLLSGATPKPGEQQSDRQPEASPVPPDTVGTSPSGNTPLIIGASVAAASFLLAGLLAGAIYLRRIWLRNPPSYPGQFGEMEMGFGSNRLLPAGGKMTSESSSSFGSKRIQPVISQDSKFGKISSLKEDPIKLGLIAIEESIGTGFTAQVWRSYWMGTKVACKVLRLDFMLDAVRTLLLEGMEANLVSELSHPNIIRTFQIYHVYRTQEASTRGSQNGTDPAESTSLRLSAAPSASSTDRDQAADSIWIVQEFCEGGDLSRAIQEQRFHANQQVDVATVLEILRQIALALRYLHKQGIVHGDLKCENVLLADRSSSAEKVSVKVTDFGLAHSLPAGLDYYLSSNLLGDYKYMAPEALIDHKISAKMDTYSFGLIVYELATGCKLEPAPTSARHVANLSRGMRPEFPEGAHSGLKALSESCWAELPDHRPDDHEIITKLSEMKKAARLSEPERHPSMGLPLGSLDPDSGYLLLGDKD